MVGRNIQTQKLQYELDERYQALRLIPKGMSGKITLLCWVQGDKLKRVFPIHIELGDTLSDLKHAIQTQKKSFQHLEWDSLELHKVSKLYWRKIMHNSDSLVVRTTPNESG